MQYELAANRGIVLNDDSPSKTLLYFYSKYKKERDEAQQAAAATRGGNSWKPAW